MIRKVAASLLLMLFILCSAISIIGRIEANVIAIPACEKYAPLILPNAALNSYYSFPRNTRL